MQNNTDESRIFVCQIMVNHKKTLKIHKTVGMKKIFFALLLFIGISSYAQQDPMFSQNMFNKLLVNPAFAGGNDLISVDLLARYQWVGIDDAPQTYSISMHSPLRNNHHGLGFYVYGDITGPSETIGLMGSYAYRIKAGKGKLCFGLEAGFRYNNVHNDEINAEEPDIVDSGKETKTFKPDANIGIYYYSKTWFGGISTKQLLQNEPETDTLDVDYSNTRLVRRFYGIVGVNIPVSGKITIRPSIMAKYVPDNTWQCDFNTSVLYSNLFWVGVSYRTEKAVVMLTEWNIAKNLRLGYSYDMYLGDNVPANGGTHEIRLGLDFDIFNSKMETPRYAYF